MLELLEDFEDSPEPEPNVYFSGPLLDGRFVVYDGGDPGRPKLGTGVPDEERAASVVAELKSAGADFIKVYELVSPEVYAALVGAAWRARLPIASHVPLMMTADDAGPLADSMEHLRNLELACAKNWEQLLATRRARISGFVEGRGYDLRSALHKLQRVPAIEDYDEVRCDAVLKTLTGTIQVPTLRLNTVAVRLPFDHPDWPRALGELPEPIEKAWQARAGVLREGAVIVNPRSSEWSEFLIGRLKANGVPIGAGTDTPIGLGLPGWSLHTELEQLVAAGLSPREALLAATVVAASFLGNEDEVGRIQPGMTADLVLLGADPLTDIRNTRQIKRVMLDGKWVRQEEL
ncbi:MAG: amidohydrolase family protein, partial [Pseudomonadota bacterium]